MKRFGAGVAVGFSAGVTLAAWLGVRYLKAGQMDVVIDKVVISEGVEEMKPVWSGFIRNLGYTDEQGEKFAEGYAEELGILPAMEKLQALSHQHDACMDAGFVKAGIDPDEAFSRVDPLV